MNLSFESRDTDKLSGDKLILLEAYVGYSSWFIVRRHLKSWEHQVYSSVVSCCRNVYHVYRRANHSLPRLTAYYCFVRIKNTQINFNVSKNLWIRWKQEICTRIHVIIILITIFFLVNKIKRSLKLSQAD